MKSITDFPNLPLALLPTPICKLENLSRETGKNIYIKRDDMTGAALGGNKVRKLEFLLADAKAKGADVVLTAGGPQSNHAALTAACAGKLGMESILVLKKRGVLSGGNLIVDGILGAQVRFVDTDSYDDVYAEMDRLMEALRAQGRTPYFIPVGGSVPVGCLGYVNCALEIAGQAEEMDALLEAEAPVTKDDIHIRYHIGPGYAQPSMEGCEAVRRLARTEGILADPVYTGKALAGFFRLLEEGYFDGEDTILFLHTGGAGALFAVEMV